MTTIDIQKTNLIEKILAIPNSEILLELDSVLNNFMSKQQIIITTNDQKKSIKQGITDIKNGDFFSQTEANKMDLQWLNEK